MCVAIFVLMLISYFAKPLVAMTKSSDKYGPFVLTSIDFEKCRGPKSVDLAEISCKFGKDAENHTIGTFELNVADVVKLEDVKIMVYNLKSGKKNVLWNYKLPDPCKHFAVGSLLALHLKAEKCVVKPGNYVFDLDITDMVQKFFGNSFFYGDYYFKVLGLAKRGNFACITFHQVFEKKVVA